MTRDQTAASSQRLNVLTHFVCALEVSQVFYTVDANVPTDWSGFTGRININMVKSSLCPPTNPAAPVNGGGGQQEGGGRRSDRPQEGEGGGVVVLLCGPPPMIQKACRPALKELGYADDEVIEF